MQEGAYPTPAQVSVFLGQVWLDDAYRIEYRDQNPMIPLYGYSEPEFTNVAQGKRIVQGNIIINYRYPEYLRAAIEGFGKEKVQMDRTVTLAHQLRNASVNERIALIEDARMKGVGHEVEEVFIEKFAKVERSGMKDLPSTLRLDPQQELELRIYYDTPQLVNYYTVIEGVRLVGRAMTISNAAQGGGDASHSGQNLFELYTFFAKRIVNRRTPKQAWNVNEYTDRSIYEVRGEAPPEPVRMDNTVL